MGRSCTKANKTLLAVLPVLGTIVATQILAVQLLAPKVVEAGITYPRGDATTDGNDYQQIAQTEPWKGAAAFILCVESPFASGPATPAITSETLRWCKQAAELGNPAAQLLLGELFDGGHGVSRDGAQAAHWYRLAAEQGIGAAQFRLGTLYHRGDGLTQDFSQAARWYERAAVQSHVEAQFYLGLFYKNGQGVPRNISNAVNWLRGAGEKGHAEAQTILGMMYRNSEGVPRDHREAASWLRRAADQNHAMAQLLLSGFYVEGQGVPRDLVEAFKWASLAAAADPDKSKARDVVASMLNGDQIVEAWLRIDEWRAAHSDARNKRALESKALSDLHLFMEQIKETGGTSGIHSPEDTNAVIADQEVTVQQAADLFERGCVGASQAIGKEVGGSDVKVQEAIRICLLGTAKSVERDLKAAQVSAQVRAKHEAVIREIRRRASTK